MSATVLAAMRVDWQRTAMMPIRPSAALVASPTSSTTFPITATSRTWASWMPLPAAVRWSCRSPTRNTWFRSTLRTSAAPFPSMTTPPPPAPQRCCPRSANGLQSGPDRNAVADMSTARLPRTCEWRCRRAVARARARSRRRRTARDSARRRLRGPERGRQRHQRSFARARAEPAQEADVIVHYASLVGAGRDPVADYPH